MTIHISCKGLTLEALTLAVMIEDQEIAIAIIPEMGEIIRYGKLNLLPPLSEEDRRIIWKDYQHKRDPNAAR